MNFDFRTGQRQPGIWFNDGERSGARHRRLSQDAFVVAFVQRDDVVGAEFFLGVKAGALAHFAATIGAGENLDGVTSGGSDVAGFDEITIHAIFNDFWDAADIGGDDRHFASHSFESGEAKRFQSKRLPS